MEEVAKAVGGSYCRLQMPLSLALPVRETVAPRGGGGGLQCIPGPHHVRCPPPHRRSHPQGSFAQFGPYYSAVLASDPFAAVVRPGAHGELWRQDVGVESTNALLRQLPPSLQARVTPLGAEEAVQTGLQAMRAARVRPMHAHVQGVVWRVSIAQTCKGLLTAGVSKAWTYAMRKLKIGAASAG